MARSLELEIKATSNVEAVAGRAKSAVSGLDKQVADIGRKFSNSFKDIFLSIAAPTILLNRLVDVMISFYEERKRKEAEANQAAIDGTNALMSAEDIYWARKKKNREDDAKRQEQNQIQIEERTLEFIKKDQRGYDMLNEADKRRMAVGDYGDIITNKGYQEQVRKFIGEELSAKGQIAKPGSENNFKGFEGYGNVIGVGPSPVVDAMNQQLEVQKEQRDLLRSLVERNPFSTPENLTDKSSGIGSPSRAPILSK